MDRLVSCIVHHALCSILNSRFSPVPNSLHRAFQVEGFLEPSTARAEWLSLCLFPARVPTLLLPALFYISSAGSRRAELTNSSGHCSPHPDASIRSLKHPSQRQPPARTTDPADPPGSAEHALTALRLGRRTASTYTAYALRSTLKPGCWDRN